MASAPPTAHGGSYTSTDELPSQIQPKYVDMVARIRNFLFFITISHSVSLIDFPTLFLIILVGADLYSAVILIYSD